MSRIIISGLLGAALWIGAAGRGAALAEPETDMTVQAQLAARFDPFDKAAGTGWEPAFPTPIYRKAPQGGPEAVPLSLQAGSYMIVVLCNCDSMDVSLIGPGGTKIEPIRHNDQGAMYSLDAAVAGDYLTGIDMGDCDSAKCDLAVKVYRKKKA